jgi:hypothetical protein
MADLIQYYGTGRRKSSIARVFLRPGSGNFIVNKKDVDVYFVTAQQRASARRSLGIADIGETFEDTGSAWKKLRQASPRYSPCRRYFVQLQDACMGPPTARAGHLQS